jgi:hypothetical protein
MKQIRRSPKPSRAFTDLKGSTAADLTADQYDQIVADAYLEEANRQDLLDLALVAGSKQSPGGPRAGTSKLVQDSASDTGSRVLYTPSQGEVWLLEEIVTATTTSGTWSLAIDLIVGGATMPILPTTNKTDTFLMWSSAFGFPTANFYLDENCTIFITLGGSFSNSTTSILLTRYR